MFIHDVLKTASWTQKSNGAHSFNGRIGKAVGLAGECIEARRDGDFSLEAEAWMKTGPRTLPEELVSTMISLGLSLLRDLDVTRSRYKGCGAH